MEGRALLRSRCPELADRIYGIEKKAFLFQCRAVQADLDIVARLLFSAPGGPPDRLRRVGRGGVDARAIRGDL